MGVVKEEAGAGGTAGRGGVIKLLSLLPTTAPLVVGCWSSVVPGEGVESGGMNNVGASIQLQADSPGNC